MNIEESEERVKKWCEFYRLREKTNIDFLFSIAEKDIPIEAIETLLTAYGQKCNYIKENEIYKKNLFNSYEEKSKELEKEKEKNKELEKKLEEINGINFPIIT